MYNTSTEMTFPNSQPSRTDLDQVDKRFATVGSRLAKRKDLYVKRRRLCDASLFLAVMGVAIMMLETELVAHDVSKNFV